mgnify:CR=1 FL=1
MPREGFFSEADVKMVPECSVAIEKAYQMEQVPMHQHEFTEIAFVARGTAIHHHVTTDGTHHTDSLIQGDVFSIQKGERHGYDACGTMVLYNISLRQDFLEQFRHLDVLPGWDWFFGNRTGTPRVVVHVPVGQRTRGMENLDRAVAEFRMRPLAYEIMTTSLVVDFLISVMRSAQFLRPSVEEEMACILDAITIMEENPTCHFSLKQLASKLNMSVSSFSKKFRDQIGISPMEYLLKIRLLQVQYLLASNSKSMNEIAAESGFCSANYMIKLFRRAYGITPAKYRKSAALNPSK